VYFEIGIAVDVGVKVNVGVNVKIGRERFSTCEEARNTIINPKNRSAKSHPAREVVSRKRGF